MKKSLVELDNEKESRDLGITGTDRGKILLVDDDPDLLSSLSDLLQLEGYEVAVSNDVESAGRATAEFEPDVAPSKSNSGSTELKSQKPSSMAAQLSFLFAIPTPT